MTNHPETKQIDSLPVPQMQEKTSRLFNFSVLAAAILFVLAGIYYYQIAPALTKDIPTHSPLTLDEEPVELINIPARHLKAGKLPTEIASSRGSLYFAVEEEATIYKYSSDLDLLQTIRFDSPQKVRPSSIEFTDSFMIVADRAGQSIAIYDREASYVSSVSWYPGKSSKLKPVDLSIKGGSLCAIDALHNCVMEISLIEKQPFYQFLELLDCERIAVDGRSSTLKCILAAPDGNLWAGTIAPPQIIVLDQKTHTTRAVQSPELSRITSPEDLLLISDPDSTRTRIHALDRGAGKVFVYNLAGNLTLVYPRSRSLDLPLSIQADPQSRRIFITESGSDVLTVFGY